MDPEIPEERLPRNRKRRPSPPPEPEVRKRNAFVRFWHLPRKVKWPILAVVAIIAISIAGSAGGSSSDKPSVVVAAPKDTVTPKPTATPVPPTPDAVGIFSSKIAHQRQVIGGVIEQFSKDAAAYNAGTPGSIDALGQDMTLISKAVSDAESAPLPPGLDATFVAVTQSLDAISKTAYALSFTLDKGYFADQLNKLSDHPTRFPFTGELARTTTSFTTELQALDKATATLPVAVATQSDAVPMERQIEKSIRDNKNAVYPGSYSFDNLSVRFDPAGGLATVSINPDGVNNDTELLTNASAMVVIAGKAVWSSYPQVATITVTVAQPRKDAAGKTSNVDVIVATYGRAKGAALPYLHLTDQPHDDNKQMICKADSYSVATYIWGQLKDKGCLVAPTGGAKPAPDPRGQ